MPSQQQQQSLNCEGGTLKEVYVESRSIYYGEDMPATGVQVSIHGAAF